MSKKILFIITTFLVSFLISGCKDYLQIHEIIFASSIAFDYNVDNKEYDMYLYFLNDLNVSNSQNQSLDPDVLGFTAKGSGKTLNEAYELIKKNCDLVIDMHHLQTMILHERFFTNQNILKIYNILKYSSKFDPSFEIYITDSEIKDIYTIQNMSETTSFYTILTGVKEGSQFNPTTFLDLCNDILITELNVIYPVISVNKEIFGKHDENYSTIEHTGYGILKNNDTLNVYKISQLEILNFVFPFKDYTFKIEDTVISINHFRIKYKLKSDYLLVKLHCEIKILANVEYEEALNSKIQEYFTNNLLELKILMDNDNIDFFNINYLKYLKSGHSDSDYYKTIPLKLKFNINAH